MNRKIMVSAKYEQSYTYCCKKVYHRRASNLLIYTFWVKTDKTKQTFCNINMICNLLRKEKSKGRLGGSVG